MGNIITYVKWLDRSDKKVVIMILNSEKQMTSYNRLKTGIYENRDHLSTLQFCLKMRIHVIYLKYWTIYSFISENGLLVMQANLRKSTAFMLFSIFENTWRWALFLNIIWVIWIFLRIPVHVFSNFSISQELRMFIV